MAIGEWEMIYAQVGDYVSDDVCDKLLLLRPTIGGPVIPVLTQIILSHLLDEVAEKINQDKATAAEEKDANDPCIVAARKVAMEHCTDFCNSLLLGLIQAITIKFQPPEESQDQSMFALSERLQWLVENPATVILSPHANLREIR